MANKYRWQTRVAMGAGLLSTLLACSLTGLTGGTLSSGSIENDVLTPQGHEGDLESAQPTSELDPTTIPPDAAPPALSPHAEGKAVTLVLPGCFDLDAGVLAGAPEQTCDLNFLPGRDVGTIEVFPMQGGAVSRPEASTEPAMQCVSGFAEGERSIVIGSSGEGAWFCYLTSDSRPGFLRVTGLDFERYSLTFDWQTYPEVGVPLAETGAGSERIYRNEDLGFQLEMPESWTDYEVTQNRFENVINVCFTRPLTGPFCTLQIDAFSHEVWQGLEKIHETYYLGENARFVFGAGPYLDDCTPPDAPECQPQQERQRILDSFTAW